MMSNPVPRPAFPSPSNALTYVDSPLPGGFRTFSTRTIGSALRERRRVRRARPSQGVKGASKPRVFIQVRSPTLFVESPA